MRRPSLIARIALGCALAAALAIAACGSEESTGGSVLADRWLRVGEDLGTAVEVFDQELPPNFAELLNAGVTTTDEDDAIALPVHPDGELLGSFRIRRPDGSTLVWVIFDVPGNDAAVHGAISDQLDQSPWQVVGGQSSSAISVVRFQSTLNGNIDGTAVVQPLPSAAEYTLEIDRDGNTMTLDVSRSAPAPLLEADLVERDGGVVVRRVDAGSANSAGLQADDRIVAVDGEPVESLADVDRALRALVQAGDPEVTLVYILEVGAAQAPREPTFVMPDGRTLPESFPASFLVNDEMTVLEVSWASQGGQGAAYQATLLTETEAGELADRFRDSLESEGWEITNDQSIGFATQLDFTSPDGDIAGRASIDTFSADSSLTSIALQLQSTPASGG